MVYIKNYYGTISARLISNEKIIKILRKIIEFDDKRETQAEEDVATWESVRKRKNYQKMSDGHRIKYSQPNRNLKNEEKSRSRMK